MHLPHKPNQPWTSAQGAFLALVDLLTGAAPQEQSTAEFWSELVSCARFHKLQGLLYARLIKLHTEIPLELMQQLEKEWMSCRWTNILLMESLQELELDLRDLGVRVCRLKGSSLLERVYDDPGARILSDIDILVTPRDFEKTEKYLLEKGFEYKPVLEFEASMNRKNFIKKHGTGLEISFDVHTEAFWRQPKEFSHRIIHDEQNFYRLDQPCELLHLIVNWVEQDTCVSFNKMFDIYFYILKSNLDWKPWFLWARKHGHERSIRMVEIILANVFGYKWEILPVRKASLNLLVARKMLNPNFLQNPQKNKFLYYLLKHLSRSKSLALTYDLQWAVAHLKKIFNK